MSAILQKYPDSLLNSRQELIACYQLICNTSAAIYAPLNLDDYQIQSIVETNPPIWHLAHVTWGYTMNSNTKSCWIWISNTTCGATSCGRLTWSDSSGLLKSPMKNRIFPLATQTTKKHPFNLSFRKQIK